jgi:hypothetical protein
MNVGSIRERRSVARVALACVLVLALAEAGCDPRPLPLPGRGNDPRELPGQGTSDRTARTPQGELAPKYVAGKEAPATLIAEDGSRCTVPEPRYREVSIGERVLCAWRTGSRTP